MMAKQGQSRHPASWFLDRRLHPTFGSGAYEKRHCAQGRDGGPDPRPIGAGWAQETETNEGDPGTRKPRQGKQRLELSGTKRKPARVCQFH